MNRRTIVKIIDTIIITVTVYSQTLLLLVTSAPYKYIQILALNYPINITLLALTYIATIARTFLTRKITPTHLLHILSITTLTLLITLNRYVNY